MAITKVCVRCGKPFEATGNRAAYCSEECKFPEQHCENCGKTFRPSKNSTGRFCSKTCWHAANTGVPRAESKPKRTCAVCGEEFIPPKKYSRCCSKACLDQWRQGKRDEKLAEAPTACALCDKPISIKVRLAGGRFCSQECAYASRSGEQHPNWQGGRHLDDDGYVRIWTPEGRRLEHQLVMEETLGRKLQPHEKVHHKNGITDDNRPENLELWLKAHPPGQRVDDLLDWVVEHYRDELTDRLLFG